MLTVLCKSMLLRMRLTMGVRLCCVAWDWLWIV